MSALTQRLQALAAAATPGPRHAADRGIGWEVHRGEAPRDSCWEQPVDSWCQPLNDGERETFAQGDAALLAALDPETVTALVAVAEAAEARATCQACEGTGRESGWEMDAQGSRHLAVRLCTCETRLDAALRALAARAGAGATA